MRFVSVWATLLVDENVLLCAAEPICAVEATFEASSGSTKLYNYMFKLSAILLYLKLRK